MTEDVSKTYPILISPGVESEVYFYRGKDGNKNVECAWEFFIEEIEGTPTFEDYQRFCAKMRAEGFFR